MPSYLPSLNQLVSRLSQLPGIGPKSAMRMAYYLLKSPTHLSEEISDSLLQIKNSIHLCSLCFAYTEESKGICRICQDPYRLGSMICVVEMPSDLDTIESSSVFKGFYHVLHGVIAPLDGVGPKDLKIQALLNRLQTLKESGRPVEEVILALDADIEGDTTALYLSKILRKNKTNEIKVTRIAHGVPIGGDINYIDYRTLGRAIENRVSI